jgi:hypothetical protein
MLSAHLIKTLLIKIIWIKLEKAPPYPSVPDPVNYHAAPPQPIPPGNPTTVIIQAPGANSYFKIYLFILK